VSASWMRRERFAAFLRCWSYRREDRNRGSGSFVAVVAVGAETPASPKISGRISSSVSSGFIRCLGVKGGFTNG
jgi:hypothetical protein